MHFIARIEDVGLVGDHSSSAVILIFRPFDCTLDVRSWTHCNLNGETARPLETAATRIAATANAAMRTCEFLRPCAAMES